MTYHDPNTNYRNQGQYQQQYSQQQYGNPNQNPQQRQPKFDTKLLIVNLSVLTVLGGIITFAAVLVTDLIVSAITNTANMANPEILTMAIISALLGLLVGLVYLPIHGTGNETLFNVAIIALAVLAAVIYVVLGGLLDGNWQTLTLLTVIICTTAIALLAPSRIEAAAF